LVATTSSDAESGTNYEDEDEVYYKLTRSELVGTVKELITHYQSKSSEFRILKGKFYLVIRENDSYNLEILELEEQNRYFRKMTDKWSNKPLSEQEIALQEFNVTGIDRSKVAYMIYGVRRNKGERIGFTKEFGKPKSIQPTCSDCI
jgi:hypothetical protein